MKYLGDDKMSCPLCEGYGIVESTGADCPRCDGIGAIPITDYTEAPDPWPSTRYLKTTIWSPLLCDPETIERQKRASHES